MVRGGWEKGEEQGVGSERVKKEDETLWLSQGPERVGSVTPQKFRTPVRAKFWTLGYSSWYTVQLKFETVDRFPPPSLVGNKPPLCEFLSLRNDASEFHLPNDKRSTL